MPIEILCFPWGQVSEGPLYIDGLLAYLLLCGVPHHPIPPALDYFAGSMPASLCLPCGPQSYQEQRGWGPGAWIRWPPVAVAVRISLPIAEVIWYLEARNVGRGPLGPGKERWRDFRIKSLDNREGFCPLSKPGKPPWSFQISRNCLIPGMGVLEASGVPGKSG